MTSKKDNITCNIKVRQCLYMTQVVHQTRTYLCFPSIKRLFITPPGWDYTPSLRLLPSISSAFPSNLLVLISFFFFFTLITAILLTSWLQKITYSTVTSIATLPTVSVFYKYVRYSAIQYLKQYWLKSD